MANSQLTLGASGEPQYITIATASANQTYKEQLQYLEPYYNNLTDAEKVNAILMIGGNSSLYRAINLSGRFIYTVYGSSKLTSRILLIGGSSSAYIEGVFNISGEAGTTHAYTNETNENTLTLNIIVN